MTGFILTGIIVPPFLWAACIICLTGDIFHNRVKKDGTLARWPIGNKVAGIIILIVQLLAIVKGIKAIDSTPPKNAIPAVKGRNAADWETLPVGFKVVHSPNPVRGPEGPIPGVWPFKWTYRTEIKAIKQPLRVTRFMILAWDGQYWILDKDQKNYNSGEGGSKQFAEWYNCPDGKIEPGKPAIDERNWAGNKARTPFKQKWVVIGEDAAGMKYKGEGIVEFLAE
ncbi:MAG: hypothetical protein K1X57_19570 [Gemmataceae bacterium]|nr:hypothetical protein [Gemmataceae bacterium]